MAKVVRGMATAMERLAQPANVTRLPATIGLREWSNRYLPDNFILPPSRLHLWLCQQCDVARGRRGQRFNVLGPRGSAKSTIASFANPLRCAVEGWEPLIWIVSETENQAKKCLNNIKEELTDNTLLARDYPEACGKGPHWSRQAIRLRNGVGIEAYGTGQRIRGIRQGANRPTLIICDDIQSDDVMTSGNRRDKDWQWLNGSLLKAGTKRTNVFNLATALHRDAIGLRLTRTPGWLSQVFQAIVRWPDQMGLWEQWAELYHDMENVHRSDTAGEFYDRNRAAMDAGAELLWPEEEDLLTLMQMRADSGHGTFEREKQCRPISPEQCEFPESYFDDHIWFERWPDGFQIRTLALDPSKGKDAKRSDFSAFVMLQVGADGLLYVDADLARRPTPQIVTDGVELYRQFRPQAFGVESNAFQSLLGDDFEQEFARQQIHGASCHLLNNSANKAVRIRTLGPLLAQKRLRFKQGSAGALLLVSQLKDFPDPHCHDDGPDALEMAIRLAGDMLAEAPEQPERAYA